MGLSASSDIMLTVSNPRNEKQSSEAPARSEGSVSPSPKNGCIVKPPVPAAFTPETI
ncbi:hypothetical protein D3C84_1071950 [compost metagenome]